MFYPQIFDSPKKTHKMSDRSSECHTSEHSPPPPSHNGQNSKNTSSSSSPKTCSRSSRKKHSSGSEGSVSPYFQIKKPPSFFGSPNICKKTAHSPSEDDVFQPHTKTSTDTSTVSSNGHIPTNAHATDDTTDSNGDTAILTNSTTHYDDTPPILTAHVHVHECPSPSVLPDPPTRVVLAPSVPATLGFSPKTPPKKPPRARSRPQSAYSALVTGEGSKDSVPPIFPNSQRYKPYSTKLANQPLVEQTPPTDSNLLVSSEVTNRLADLETSLESSFHRNLETKGDLSPSRKGQQADRRKIPINRLSPSPSPIRTYRYMSSAGTRLSPASVRSEFEYSMEPRNFSRQVVKSPPRSIAPPSFIEEENLLNGVGTHGDNSDVLEVPQSSLAEKLSSSPMNKNWSPQVPVSPHFSSSPKKSPNTPFFNTTPAARKPSTTPPSSRTHQRSNSEDLNSLVLSLERCLVTEEEPKVQTRHSPGSPKKKRSDTVSSANSRSSFSPPSISTGVEETLNWHIMDPSDYNKLIQKQQQQPPARKTSFFSTLFGGDKHDIYNPKNISTLVSRHLVKEGTKVSVPNEYGDTPLHCYIKSGRDDRLDLLLGLLVHCNVKLLDINKEDNNGDTPLHVATKLNDDWCIKALISFGADINCSNNNGQTPLDFVMSHVQRPESGSFDVLHELFSQLHALPGGRSSSRKPRLLTESLNSLVNESYEIDECIQLGSYLDERRLAAFVFKLEEMLQKQNLQFSINTGVNLLPGQVDHNGTFFDPLISRQIQLLRINEYKSTLEFKKGAGSRMLFLDGGGIRGLIQIEILMFIEGLTGRKITELFDWIIGTSTGGIIALALVYLGMSLGEVRQLYFQLREEVFAGGVLSISKRTDALERMLKTQFKDKRLKDVEYPKVLISAVSSKTNPPSLHYFNNCFDDKYSNELVWKVARYTSAGPTYFSECDDFLDGGVLANNPCTTSWVEICNYYDKMGLPKPKVAMAISVGTGNYPPEILGETDLFGKGWLDLRGTFRRAHRFIKMLSNALVESENVAQIFEKTCEASDIKFLRFSPSMPMTINPDEKDSKVLIDMIIETKSYLNTQDCKRNLDSLVRHFRHLAEVSRGLNLNK